MSRLYSFCWFAILNFMFALHPLIIAIPHSLEVQTEQDLMRLMEAHMSTILKECPLIKGDFLQVRSLSDSGGSFINSVYLIDTSEQEELIIKIANPIWRGSKTLNEVTALRFLKKHSIIPVPDVYLFDNDLEHSLIGREYIIMPRLKGRPLNLEMPRLYQDRQSYYKVLEQLAASMGQLKQFRFSGIGNFRPNGLEQEISIAGIVDFAGYQVEAPCTCYAEYAKHALCYYISEMERLAEEGCQDAAIYRVYIPILKDLLMNSSSFDFLNQDEDVFAFSHQDFVMKNILVDGDVVTGIVDWEWSGSTLDEIEPMTGFDFLQTEEDRQFFKELLARQGLPHFFDPPPPSRELFYRLIGNVYSLVAFREWEEGKLEHTAKFLSQKLEQRKIRNHAQFDFDRFLLDLCRDLDDCIQEFTQKNIQSCKQHFS